jgi:cytochrome b pre-mRNA-processing protein 3
MILRLFRRPTDAATIHMLYGAIVAQARLPVFYEDFGVPDTVEGRFDMIVLHLALLLQRLKGEPQGAEFCQALFDRFCLDMDHNLREMGVGDLVVPKKMKRLAEAFYGRVKVYDAALQEGDSAALTAALSRNVFSGTPGVAGGAERLARYMRQAAKHLATMDESGFSRGLLAFPAPDANLDDHAPAP